MRSAGLRSRGFGRWIGALRRDSLETGSLKPRRLTTIILTAILVAALVPTLFFGYAAACHWEIYYIDEIDQVLSGPEEIEIDEFPFLRQNHHHGGFDASHGVHSGHRHDISTHWYVVFCYNRHYVEVRGLLTAHESASDVSQQIKFEDSGMEIVQVGTPPASWAYVSAGGEGDDFVTLYVEGDYNLGAIRTWDFFVKADIPSNLWGSTLTIDFTLTVVGKQSTSWTENIEG